MNWLEQIENLGLYPKLGYYENNVFMDLGTIWDLEDEDPEEIIQVTLTELRYLQYDKEYRFYAESFPTDAFGQTATFRNPPACYWSYMDMNTTISGCDLPEGFFEICEEPEHFTDWANYKYPRSFSYVGEIPDSEITQQLWEVYTYNPKLPEAEVTRIMREYLEEQ
jgi:hypothetical protein